MDTKLKADAALDAIDALSRGRDLLNLLSLAFRLRGDDDARAVAAGADAALHEIDVGVLAISLTFKGWFQPDPAAEVALAADPILPIFAAWQAASAAINDEDLGPERADPAEMEALDDQRQAALRQLAFMIPTSAEGLAALAEVALEEFGPGYRRDNPLWQEVVREPEYMIKQSILWGAKGLAGMRRPAPR